MGETSIRPCRPGTAGRRVPFGPSAIAPLATSSRGTHRVYFAGDTDIFPEMADARDAPLDLAILPVGGWGPTLRGGHMDPFRRRRGADAAATAARVRVHWGTLWPIGLGRIRRDRFEEPGRRFVEAARQLAPEVSVTFLDPGRELDLYG